MNDFVKDIVDWLESERVRLAEIARSEDWLGKLLVPRPIATEIEGDRCTFKYEAIDYSIDQVLFRLLKVEPRVSREPTPLARSLHQEFGPACFVHSEMSDVDFGVEPARWIQVFLLDSLRADYLVALGMFDRSDRDKAAQLATGLLSLLATETLEAVEAVPAAGLQLEGPALTAHGEWLHGTVRPLTPSELGSLWGARHSPAIFQIDRFGRRRFGIVGERVAVEARMRFKKSEDLHTGMHTHLPLKRLMLAMKLLGFDVSGEGLVIRWTEPGPSFYGGAGGSKLMKSGSVTKSVIAEKDFRRAVSLAERIPVDAFHSPRKRQDVALHRIDRCLSEDRAGDALVDGVIALEALFLPESNQGELSFRLKLFGSHFLGSDQATRKQVFDHLDHIYKVRSKLVHGLKSPTAEELKMASAYVKDIASRVVIKSLEEGFPDQRKLQDLVVNAGAAP